MGKDNSVSVALCSYNGSSFIKEQLLSIAGQSLLPEELVICDDASCDSTIQIVNNFSQKSPFPVKFIKNDKRIGVLANFSMATSLCQGDYIALSDQDDVWLPDKLKITLQAMQEAEKKYGSHLPMLVHSDLLVIDSAGRTLAPSFMKYINIKHLEDRPLNNLLVQNFVTGCTVMLNRSLLEVALPVPDDAAMHDWWFALVAALLGRIVFVPEATVLYRQHLSNVVGAKRYYNNLNYFLKVRKLKELDLKVIQAYRQGLALKERLTEANSNKDHKVLEKFVDSLLAGGFKAFKHFLINRIGRQDLPGTLMLYFLLLKGSYLSQLSNNKAAENI